MARIQISHDLSGRIIVFFPYDPLLVEKVETIKGRRWQPAEKHWSFPNSEDILQKILKVFAANEIQIDPALQAGVSIPVIARSETHSPVIATPTLSRGRQSPIFNSEIPPLEKGGKEGFEDLRRDLLSRKYSYKTVKRYIYYNKDFINFIDKDASKVNDNDIKDYLLYL